MNIEKNQEADIEKVMDLFEAARNYMIQNGNPTQWENGYPNEEILREDMRKGCSYVCVEEDTIVGTFTFIIGEEPTYQIIKDGAWNQDKPYGTIHRLASSGTVPGIAKACFDYCSGQIDYLRIDTHRDNRPMQAAIQKYGFKECGTIFVRDGSMRIAYDYQQE